MGKKLLTDEERQASKLRRKEYLRRYYLEHREERNKYMRELYALKMDKEARMLRSEKRRERMARVRNVLLDVWISGDMIKIAYARDNGKTWEKQIGTMKGRTLRRSWNSVYRHYRSFSDEDICRIKRVFESVQSLIINGREEIPHGTKQGA